jgi:alpha-tubulin suppressor-like RCC1 family protein/Tol biopolymer transport system component
MNMRTRDAAPGAPRRVGSASLSKLRLQALSCAAVVLGVLISGHVDAQLAPLLDVTQMVGGDAHSCALIQGGKAYCWGGNESGQLGDDSTSAWYTAIEVEDVVEVTPDPAVTMLAAGAAHSCALLIDGRVKCWGRNVDGQLGDNTQISRARPVFVAGLAPGTQSVAAGAAHTCVRTATNGASCWGDNQYGQLGDNSSMDRSLPVDVPGVAGEVLAIVAGTYHTCALVSTGGGTVKCWGRNFGGTLGNGGFADADEPVAVTGLTGVTQVVAGDGHTCALIGGVVQCWGSRDYGQVGDATDTDRPTPTPVLNLGANDVIKLASGRWFTCALKPGSEIRCWGDNFHGQLGDGSSTIRPTAVLGPTIANVASLYAAQEHICARRHDGTLQCWGRNLEGQLGDGGVSSRLTPVEVPGLAAGVQRIVAAVSHTCAITAGGAAKCWGRNDNGQLGDGTTTRRLGVAADVVGLDSGVRSIAADYDHSCAVNTAGAAVCWGRNYGGQLGDGSLSDSAVPVQVFGLTSGIASVGTGETHSCALTEAGGVLCWGINGFGQLGDGSQIHRPVPGSVSGLTSGVAAIAIAGSSGCALMSLGTVKCWGFGTRGALGNGAGTDSSTPVDVLGLAGVDAIDTAGATACALVDGAVKCWGFNNFGQVGDNSVTNRLQPVDVVGLSAGVAAISVGEVQSCARMDTGAVKCWGTNHYGQLGNGSRAIALSPVDVIGLPEQVGMISASGNHACALPVSGVLRCWGSDQNGEVGDNGRDTNRPQDVLIDDSSRAVDAVTPMANDDSEIPVTDASGRFTVLQTKADNLAPDTNGSVSDIVRIDADGGPSINFSRNNDDSALTAPSLEPSVSAEGDVALFVADDAGIANVMNEASKTTRSRAKAGGFSILLRNQITGTTQRIGIALPGGIGTQPQLAAGGRGLTFTASNAGEPSRSEVYFKPLTRLPNGEVVQGATRCLSCKAVAANGIDTAEDSDGSSRAPSISADGQWVAWETSAKNLVFGVPSPCPSVSTAILLRNVITGQLQRISAPTPLTCGTAGSGSKVPRVDWGGKRIVFESTQPLRPGDANGLADVYLFDLDQSRMMRISESTTGGDGDAPATQPSISGDGKVVSFVSASTNYDSTEGDPNTFADTHVRPVGAGLGSIRRLSRTRSGSQSDGGTRRAALNYNGTRLAFDSDATNFTGDTALGVRNVYRRLNPLNSQTVFGAGFE